MAGAEQNIEAAIRGSSERQTEVVKMIRSLTEREMDVLKQLVTGEMAKETAATFEIALHTIKNHKKQIYKKLRVAGDIQAVNVYNEYLKTLEN